MNLPEERTVFLEKDNLFVNTTSNNPKEVEYLTALQRFNKKRDNFYSMVPIEQTREQIAKNAIEDERNSLLGQIPRGAAGGIVSGVQTLERLGVGAIMQAINDTRHNFEQIALEDKRRWAAVNIKRENYATDEEYQAAQAQFDKEYKSKYAQIETTYQNVARFGREQMQEMKERHENWLKLSGLSKEESDGFLFDLSAGGASLLMALGTAALTKSPAATAAVFGAIQGRQSYEEALENGVTPEKAEKIGLAAGAAETILEKFGLEMFLQGLKSRGWAGKIVKNALIEATQEGSQGAANEIIMQKWGGKEADIRQTLEEVAYQALIGGIVGGGATSAHVGVERAMQRIFPQATAAAQGVTQEGDKLPPPTVEQAEELVRANEGRDLTPQERHGLILANGQHKLEALGVPTETARKMLADVILQAGSQESLDDVQQMLNDENNPATYKDGDIMAATKEYAEAVRATSKSMTPEYRQQVYDIRDSVREQAMEAGYSEDEAEAAAHVHEAFAQLAYQMSGVAPQEWAKRNKIEFRDQRIKEEDTSFNFGNNVEEYNQDRDGLPDDVYFQESAYTPEGKADTNSQEFKQWFEGSKVLDENGKPLVVYHGSTKKFEIFDINKANPESDLGKGFYFTDNERDVSANYEGGGPDFENKVDRIAERIQDEEGIEWEKAKAKAYEQEYETDAIYPVYLKMENPFVIGGENETVLTFEEPYNEETDEYGEPEGTLLDFAYNMDNYLADIGIDYKISPALFERAVDNGGEISASEIYDIIKADENLLSLLDYESSWGELLSNAVAQEYDGIIDHTVNQKFGSERKQGQSMSGMDQGTTHYIAFEPTQIKSVYNKGTFDASNPNIYFQDEQGEQGNTLGKTEFTDTGAIITLLEGANKTTLLHELGHVFLRDFERVALENDNAITRHYTQVIEGFLGKKEGNRWNREQQEKFARTFLEYVRTKDVPEAPEMRNVFDRFKDWLQEIYDAIEGTQFFEKNVSQEAKDFFDEVLAPQAVEVPDVAKFRGKIREIRQAVEDIRKRRLPRVENGLMLRDIKALYSQIKRRMPKAPQTDLLRELRRYGANYAQAGRIDAEAYKNARIPNKPEGIGDDPARWLQDHGYMGESYGETYEAQDNLNEQAFDLIERAMDGEKVYRLDDQAAATQREHYKEELEMIKEVSENIEGAQEVLRNINEMERKGYRALDRDDMHFLEEKIKATEKLANTELDKLEDVKKEIVDEIKKRIDADQLEAYLARISAAKNKEALEAAARRTMLAIEKCYVNRALYTQHLLQSPRQTASLKDLAAVWGKKDTDEKRAETILAKRDGIIKEYSKDVFVALSDRLRRVDKELARKIEDLPRKRVMRNSRYRKYFGDYIEFIYKYVAKNPEDFEVLSWAQMNGNEVAEMEIANKYKAQAINGKNLVQLIKEKNEGLQKIWEEGVNAGLSIGWLEGYNPRRMANSDAFIEFLEGTEEWSAIDRVLKIMGVDQGTNEQKAMAINKYFRGFEPKDLAAAKPGNIKRRDIMYVTKAMSKFYKNSFEALVDYADDMAKAISIKEVFGISEKDLDTSVGQLILNAREKYRLSHREEKLLKDAITAFVRPAKASQVVRGIKTFSYLTTITNFVSTISQLEDIGFAMAQWGHANTIRAFGKKAKGDGWIKLEQIGGEVFDVDMRKERENAMDKGLRKFLGVNGFTFMDRLGKETYINADFQARQKMAKDNPAKLQKELEGMFTKEEAKEVMTALKEGNLNNENLQSLLYFDLSAVQPMSLLDMPQRYALGGGAYKLLYQLKSFAARRANYLYTRTQEQFHNAKTPEEYARAIADTMRFFTLMIGYGAMTNLLKDFLLGRSLDITEELLDTILQNAMVTRYMIKRGKQDPMNALVNAIMPPAVGTANDLWQDTGRVISGKKGVSQMNIWSRLPVIGKPFYWWFGGGKAITEKDNKEKGLFKIKGWAGK